MPETLIIKWQELAMDAAMFVSYKQTVASHDIYQSKSATAAVHLILSCGHVFILWLKISILFTRT